MMLIIEVILIATTTTTTTIIIIIIIIIKCRDRSRIPTKGNTELPVKLCNGWKLLLILQGAPPQTLCGSYICLRTTLFITYQDEKVDHMLEFLTWKSFLFLNTS